MAAADDSGALPHGVDARRSTSGSMRDPVSRDTLATGRDVGVITETSGASTGRPPQPDDSNPLLTKPHERSTDMSTVISAHPVLVDGYTAADDLGDQIDRSSSTTGRQAEDLGGAWALPGIMSFGRQEGLQDAPEGVGQDRTGSWTRRRDEYAPQELTGGRA